MDWEMALVNTASALLVAHTNKNIAALLRNATRALSETSSSPRLDAELLLTHVLKCDRSHLYAHPEATLSRRDLSKFLSLLKRRQQREPMAYLTGIREFWSLNLMVTPEVLIPRPETELLVELALSHMPRESKAEIADLGTGSGAVGLALAYERPLWHITATDISTKALEVASANKAALGLKNISMIQGDWFEPLPHRHFDMVVSNPPYIDASDPHLKASELPYEPYQALVSDTAGLKDIGSIIRDAASHLMTNGYLLIEHGYHQAAAVSTLFQNHGFTNVKTYRDLAGQERVTVGKTRAGAYR